MVGNDAGLSRYAFKIWSSVAAVDVRDIWNGIYGAELCGMKTGGRYGKAERGCSYSNPFKGGLLRWESLSLLDRLETVTATLEPVYVFSQSERPLVPGKKRCSPFSLG